MLLDFINLIKKYDMNIKGIIHIGAHFGEEHDLYKSQNINNIIYFEPLKKNFNELLNRVNKDAILYNFALGNNETDIEMFVESANDGQSSSILKPALHLKQYPQIQFNEIEIVQMKKLDSFNFSEDYNMINIDVQGYELEVFKGADNTLKNINYIITEVNRAELYENCTMVENLDSFLQNYNFIRKETVWIGGTWGDALYVKG